MSETLNTKQTAQLGIGVVSNSCLICGKELDKETAEHGNGTCKHFVNAGTS